MRYYLDDLFPKGGIAQIPYLYGQSHNDKLNKIVEHGVRGVTADGRIYYDVPTDGEPHD